jgi:hypothetical protein
MPDDLSAVEERLMKRLALADEERRQAARRWICQVSAAHPLNGYDRNVLRVWEEGDFKGPRPKLSLEVQVQFGISEEQQRQEQQREALERARQQQRAQELIEARRLAAEKIEWKQQWIAAWRQRNPELAARRDAQKEQERQERVAKLCQAEEERQRQLALDAELRQWEWEIRQRAKQDGPETLEAPEFLHWCEKLASADELAAFDQRMIELGQKMRRPWWVTGLRELFNPLED